MPDSIQMTLGGKPVILRPGERVAQKVANAYRDTPASATARVLAAIRNGIPWREAVRQEYAEKNPWLYHIITHPDRARFIESHPPASGSWALDIGAGWGQITLPLTRHCQVVAVEPTPERMDFIHAAAEQERQHHKISFLEASFLELELPPVFDYVCCIGVLEWVAQFHREGSPRAVQVDFLRRIRNALRAGGRCCLGIENRLGLKYLMGARDDHTTLALVNTFDAHLAAKKYQALMGDELRVFTYSLPEYQELFHEAGFTRISAYAAFPDYKLPSMILPLAEPETLNAHILGAPLPPEHDGVDGHLLENQKELGSTYRSLAKMGIAHYFAPSFFFLLE